MKDMNILTPPVPSAEIRSVRKQVIDAGCIGHTTVVPLMASSELTRPLVGLPIMPEGFVTDTRLMPPSLRVEGS
jgi:hypothetical protein